MTGFASKPRGRRATRSLSDARLPAIDATLTFSTSEMAGLGRECSHMHDSNNSLARTVVGLRNRCSTG
jgi:hypothetical protein